MGAGTLDITLGKQDANNELQIETLSVDNEELGVISWQAGLPCPDPRIHAKFKRKCLLVRFISIKIYVIKNSFY